MIRGQKKPLEDKQIVNVDINTSIHNRFDIEVIDSRTGKVRQRAQAENIILDQFWTYLLAPYAYFNCIHYGSGTATPNRSDTSLTEYIGYANTFLSTETGQNLDEKYFWCRRKVQLSETTAVGETIAEIGIAYSSTAPYLCTKALLKDMNGNPISIKKTDIDIINIYATVYVHYNDKSNGVEITPDQFFLYAGAECYAHYVCSFFTEYLVGLYASASASLARPSYGSGNHCSVPVVFEFISSTNETTPYISKATFDVENKKITISAPRLAVDDTNYVGGICRIYLDTSYLYKTVSTSTDYATAFNRVISINIGDNTWYPGSTITGEAIGTGDGSTVDFSSKFRLHKNCKIMVNGSSANNVTLDIDKDIAADSCNIHFTEPPAEGDVITADYFTDVIAKDENHVFDLTVTIHLGEKVS